ncbi:BTAD domain-containing putative transcriptional regulator [Saccharopolyspora sp. WRP15-2]|uniref:BTAD domain-containing putative transcriptional regulator n=1 Tax=Saccharopolyspora oryzae TaxID=2997343 RepID=A0ABT4UU47_9PSEU|nr:BTAD domain-containing putative transcriptional regulator [Saccharopolyspora oryzae]MDA3625223.1 BTAD domain-containing putative transcriptional regulator [Saccharopolyspora oryzae]
MGEPRNDITLGLLGGFKLACGNGVLLPRGAQRLLAFLALQDDGAPRVTAAERLWPDCSPDRAASNVRSALHHAKQAGGQLIDRIGPRLQLSPAVRVDLNEVWQRANRLFEPDTATHLPNSSNGIVNDLCRELLPDWSDDWVLAHRDRWDQLRMHALEVLARHSLEREEYSAALQTALTAVTIDPIRETAHCIVMEIYIAEGNLGNALKHFQSYRSVLHREIGAAPSRRITELARDLMQN